MPDDSKPQAADAASKPQKLSPILGLPIDDDDAPRSRAAAVTESTLPAATLQLTVIIPARNEERNLPVCLESLLKQNDSFFALDKDWELLIVDDGSTDATGRIAREAAASAAGIRVMHAPPLDTKLFTGKSNACWAAAREARGRWLLFTDADTIHEPSDMIHALHEVQKHKAAMLSYSPKQIVSGFWQRALMPLVFSELASVYPMKQVNDPANRLAAANGQFLMVEREAYFAIGGHKAVGNSVLEDVDLAFNLKRSKRGLRFRYAPDALSTRMYRGFGDMVEGWTKNLALLFPHALRLAAWRVLDIALLLLPLVVLADPLLELWKVMVIWALWIRTLFRFFGRVRRSNFPVLDCLLSVCALPLFVVLLIQSWMKHHLFHQVAWKGREYRTTRQ
ncbi:Glycosyltransferase, catalytic subunit of cellulose synthase and poly-beta-1,6-N-acetylglucosamine synthase [Bryocella elongata]|uniref:Glycosyltransferase, catalytic subunit of cellulose synthase and poly-beta-1,6-N-acetylglucosamine synthase n=1 Tax=Bryocella elongata TaxID=863522 RepID=A0A1H5U0J9_9BACT|nr:glycosyltransferase [Bryocella elongata]SEF67797.1 Glycosyltransferase, catalytic subunit of cellulose synthase and poly-beta-1,6-N-acetylglucosamine synthase [Bryocella elongata]